MQRQAATPRGLERRLLDLCLEKVGDPRVAAKVTYPLPTLLTALLVGMVTSARSLRKVEERTGQLAGKHGSWMRLDRRIADNTFGKVVPRLQTPELVGRLHDLVKAEHRRGNLKPTVLPVGTVAVDGKNVATLHWLDLCRTLGLDPAQASPDLVKSLLAERFPAVQFCQPQHGEPYALARVHTVTLTSADAAMCIHQRPTLGHTNEIGSMPQLLEEVHAAYGRTGIIQMVTTDAGNTSLKVATLIVDRCRWDYFLQIKSEHGEIHVETIRALGSKTPRQAGASLVDHQNGKVVTYRLWQYDLTECGWLDWTHARQLVRIERLAVDPRTNKRLSKGNRYYVCNRPPAELGPQAAMSISRAHWRCEDETHWTADAELSEDRRRLAWSRHPNGVFVISALRMIALGILAVARKLSRQGHSLETPSWQQVAEHFLLVLCGSTLETEAFDDVELD